MSEKILTEKHQKIIIDNIGKLYPKEIRMLPEFNDIRGRHTEAELHREISKYIKFVNFVRWWGSN